MRMTRPVLVLTAHEKPKVNKLLPYMWKSKKYSRNFCGVWKTPYAKQNSSFSEWGGFKHPPINVENHPKRRHFRFATILAKNRTHPKQHVWHCAQGVYLSFALDCEEMIIHTCCTWCISTFVAQYTVIIYVCMDAKPRKSDIQYTCSCSPQWWKEFTPYTLSLYHLSNWNTNTMVTNVRTVTMDSVGILVILIE